MAIRTFELAIDNHPVYGYYRVTDIGGSGVMRVNTGVRRIQAATVAIAEQYSLPPEYIPMSGATVHRLLQKVDNFYDIFSRSQAPVPATIPAHINATVIHPTEMKVVSPQAWYLYTSTSPGDPADEVVFISQEYSVSMPAMFAITHPQAEVRGDLVYFGQGSDVSFIYGLPPGSRFNLMSGVTEDDDLAEMVFVDGLQTEGDIYYYDESYGEGAYRLIFTEGLDLEVLFSTPVDTTMVTLDFAVFRRMPRPMLRVRADDPFSLYEGNNGVWLEYFNIPKGDMTFNFMFH